MNEMIERVAKAVSIHHPYCWRNNGNSYEVWKRDEPGNLEMLIKTYATRDEAYDKVIKLNSEYIARSAIEAMRQPTDQQRNNYHELAKGEGFSALSSSFVDAVWERSIDAVLKNE